RWVRSEPCWYCLPRDLPHRKPQPNGRNRLSVVESLRGEERHALTNVPRRSVAISRFWLCNRWYPAGLGLTYPADGGPDAARPAARGDPAVLGMTPLDR